jgi:hypothetical protein
VRRTQWRQPANPLGSLPTVLLALNFSSLSSLQPIQQWAAAMQADLPPQSLFREDHRYKGVTTAGRVYRWLRATVSIRGGGEKEICPSASRRRCISVVCHRTNRRIPLSLVASVFRAGRLSYAAVCIAVACYHTALHVHAGASLLHTGEPAAKVALEEETT